MIEDIQNPQFLKKLGNRELQQLCEEIRVFLVTSISKTGGHLSSNLGIVELTVALHLIFDSPMDKIIFDVGHQSYVHKILTGRAKDFDTLRQYHGLSGFQKRHESEHDVWEAGHSSTSLSAALGFALARDFRNDNNHVIAVIGDGAFGGGMALEALNHIGEKKTNVIIVLNDNEMSISPNVGAINEILGRLRVSPFYRHSKEEIKGKLSHTSWGRRILHSMLKVKDVVKNNVVPGAFFKEMGIEYLGPIDGHNISDLKKAFSMAKDHNGPIVVHVRTIKGKGYSFSEEDRSGKWHGVGAFDPTTGNPRTPSKPNMISYSELVTKTLMKIKADHIDIQVLTPAMRGGSKLDEFFSAYPESSFDCGIAEQHTVALAAGLAVDGCRPFVAIYSSFLQRAYDQVNHDIARMDLPVVFGVDRSGLVGEDGETHHGVFDVSFLRVLPNVILCQPSNGIELQHLLYTGLLQKHPFFVRFPRGNVELQLVDDLQEIPIGTFVIRHQPNASKLIVIAYGECVDQIADAVIRQDLPVQIINARFIKPLDSAMLLSLAASNLPWLVVERDLLAGGFSSAILEFVNEHRLTVSIERLGIGDHYVEQGDTNLLYAQEHIGLADIMAAIGRYMDE